MKWSPAECAELARGLLEKEGPRWSHVVSVAQAGVDLASRGYDIPDVVVSAAWLHDIGYAPSVEQTGLHALDGAAWLVERGGPSGLVGLVGHHSGAAFEAEERGLVEMFAALPEPDPDLLDLLTMLDMTTGPDGRPVSAEQRIAEILDRYPADDPVHPVERARFARHADGHVENPEPISTH